MKHARISLYALGILFGLFTFLAITVTEQLWAGEGPGHGPVGTPSLGTCQSPLWIGTDIQSIVFNPFNQKVYAANRSNATISIITVINPGIEPVDRTIAVMAQPIALAVNPVNGKVYVAGITGFPSYVIAIDPITYAVTQIVLPLGSTTRPRSFAFAVDSRQNRIWFANAIGQTGDVSVIDSDSDTVLSRFTIPYPDLDRGLASIPWTLTFNPQNNKAYVLGYSTGDASRRALLTILDGTDFTVIRQFSPLSQILDSGARQAAMYNPITNKIYCALFSGEIVIIDGATDEIRATQRATGLTFTLALNPDRNVVYAADFEGGRVYVLDGASDALVTSIGGLTGPYGIGYNSATQGLYILDIGSPGSERLVMVDGRADRIVESCRIHPFPLFIVDNDGELVSPDDESGRTIFALPSQNGWGRVGMVFP